MEKDFLQSLKIDISRNFKPVPYERIAFHKILGITMSDNGMKILLREMEQEPDIRESAVLVLKNFNQPAVLRAFDDILLSEHLSPVETTSILDHIERNGSGEQVELVMEYVKAHLADTESHQVISKAFNVLRLLGKGQEQVHDFMVGLIKNPETSREIMNFAIMGLSLLKDISLLEDLLKNKDDDIAYNVYKSLSLMSENLATDTTEPSDNDDIPFTYTEDHEDRQLLNIRVLLGKMTSHFDSYSRKTKTSFINAMISSNHREFLIYTMKALTSDDSELIDMVLHLLLSNVRKLRDPDKLFRNLLALTADSERKNETIVNIIEQYFTNMRETRKNNIFRDKLHNYIVVTLDTYFETYRKEFMVTEVAEKGYPESFRKLRKYFLENLNPEIRKKVAHFLRNGDRSTLKTMILEISKKVPFIEPKYKEKIEFLIEILHDDDQKSRANSAQRIEDINFEKRYLRNRIVRICEIVGRLHIDEAATSLVKIYNYVKKYPDEDISNAVTYCLSMINYSYLQGELEVMMMSGSQEDQTRAVKYLSLFPDQRSMNILLDYLRGEVVSTSDLILPVFDILLRRDLFGNMTANTVFKKYIDSDYNDEIKRCAILCLGKVGVESDIDYLNDLFSRGANNEIKEAVVQAMTTVVHLNSTINRRQVMKILQEYFKDPSIRVRIYSCMILIYLGNKDALKYIRDMMIIKNKSIQREVLTLIGNQRSVEFAYFLISLLKEEYGISGDIIPILALMPKEELSEIDHFIVNIFKKYEGSEIESKEKKESIKVKTGPDLTQGWIEKTILCIDIEGYFKKLREMKLVNLIINNKILNKAILSEIEKHRGYVSKVTDGNIVSVFTDPVDAASAALRIHEATLRFNAMRLLEKRIKLSIKTITAMVKIMGDEIVFLPEYIKGLMSRLPVVNRVIVDSASLKLIEHNFHIEPFPEIIFTGPESSDGYFELISPINSFPLLEGILNDTGRRERERIDAQKKLEEDSRKRRQDSGKNNAVEYIKVMDDVGKIIKHELDEMIKYVQKRSTDRELISNVEKRVSNINKIYLTETTRIIM